MDCGFFDDFLGGRNDGDPFDWKDWRVVWWGSGGMDEWDCDADFGSRCGGSDLYCADFDYGHVYYADDTSNGDGSTERIMHD